MPLQIRGPDSFYLFFRNGNRTGLNLLRRQSCILELLEESHIGISVQRIKDEIRIRFLYFTEDGCIIRMPHRRVFLSHDLHPQGLRLLLYDGVRRSGKYIIGAQQKNLFPVIFIHIFNGRDNLLVRRRTYVKNVGG